MRSRQGTRAALIAVIAGVLFAMPATADAASWSVSSETPVEGETVTISLSSLLPETVSVTTQNGSAAAGSDYTAVNTSVNVNILGREVEVPITQDTLDEAGETFTISVSGSDPASRTITIQDDDPPPQIGVADATVVEGTGANPVALVIPVTLSAPSSQDASVAFATADWGEAVPVPAAAGGDYTATTGTVTFPAGQTTGAALIPIVVDEIDEDVERLRITFSNPVNAAIPGGPVATVNGDIEDDDTATLQVGSVAGPEGDSGETIFTLPVTLSTPSSKQITVDWSTGDLQAVAGEDYRAATGQVTFAPGDTQPKQVAVPVLGDRRVEADEAFTVQLGNAVNAALPGQPAIGAIVDDDRSGSNPGPAAPGGGGTAATGVPVVRLSAPRSTSRGATITVSCANAPCAGSVTLFSVIVRRAKIRALRREIKLGRASFTLQPGGRAALPIRLSKRNRGLVRLARALRVKAFAVAQGPSGAFAVTERRGTLRRR